MDKYEYNLKLDQIKALSAEEGYMSAAEIADSINWNKIKNVNTLVKIGEVYEKAERYQDARDILLMAYDRSPIGRMIIYRLAEVAIKMGDYDAATEYYDEFVEIAPHDDMKYVLRYAIKKGQGASFDELIAILEELKEEEYTEEWAYELAYLYHKAGKVDKCVEACDELILWFGDGPYVERALELKMLYQPLTKTQEEKYRQFKIEKETISREKEKETEPESETDDDKITEIGAMEMVKGGEIVHDDVKIPQITVNQEKFNTVNLQEEIAKGMKQIMDAKGKNEVSDTMDNIKKMVEEIPFLKFLKDKDNDKKSEQPSEEELHIATDEEIDGTLRMNFKELLGEDSDGQMSMVMNEKTQLEHQITGQMSIQDVLDEWEKTKRAAEMALNEANQQKLESAKARALQEAGDIMERLNDVIPKLDAGATPKELLEKEYMQGIEIPKVQETVQEPAEEPQPEIQDTVEELQPETQETVEESQSEIQETAEEPQPEIPETVEELQPETQETAEEPQPEPQETVEELQPEIHDIAEELQPETQETMEEPQPETTEAVEEFAGEPEDAIVAEESEEAEILAQPTMLMPEITDDMLKNEEADEEPEEEPERPRDFEHVTSFIEQEIAKMAAKNPGIEKKLEMAKTRKMPNLSLPEDLDSEEDDETVIDSKHINELTSEQRAIFSYFIPVKGMENQICKAYNGIIDHLNKKGNASSGNLIIQGEQGCGKTMLATSFVKVLQKVGQQSTGKLGKIDASALNKKDAQQILRKIAGGCLIIERAGEIDRNTAVQLSFLMDHDITGTLYILEDTSKGIKRALSMDEGFAAKFTEKISVPIFTNDELVLFAKSYSTELGYKIDEMAILALHNRISNIERIDQATTLTEVKEIIDEAIDREAHSGLKKAISILTAKRYTDDDRIVLREDHFKEK
mgnify:CR=1 FL=1